MATEDEDFEAEMAVETADRLADLAMALCHFDPANAKVALAEALGTLLARFQESDEGPCLHNAMGLVQSYMIAVEKDDAGDDNLPKLRSVPPDTAS